jgi:hypothetical protein
VFLDVPKELRLGAMQAVVLLMPDENREALQTLLLFLHDVAQKSSVNQVNVTQRKIKYSINSISTYIWLLIWHSLYAWRFFSRFKLISNPSLSLTS